MSHLSISPVQIVIFHQMGNLPLFNPDREGELISSVVELKQEIALADGVIIASPEYAHGISGVMKNALDWVVSDKNFPDMPVALFNCSPRATHAQSALREVLKTMSAYIVESASITVPLLSTDLNSKGILEDEILCEMITESIIIFCKKISCYKAKKGQI